MSNYLYLVLGGVCNFFKNENNVLHPICLGMRILSHITQLRLSDKDQYLLMVERRQQRHHKKTNLCIFNFSPKSQYPINHSHILDFLTYKGANNYSTKGFKHEQIEKN